MLILVGLNHRTAPVDVRERLNVPEPKLLETTEALSGIAGVLWSYRTNAGFMDLRVKQIGAVTAWILFAVLLQSYISNTYRRPRTLFISAGAFIAIVVAILGIRG